MAAVLSLFPELELASPVQTRQAPCAGPRERPQEGTVSVAAGEAASLPGALQRASPRLVPADGAGPERSTPRPSDLELPSRVIAQEEEERDAAATIYAKLAAGHVVEVGGAWGRTSFVVGWIVHAQRRGEPVAWIQGEEGSLYPPDLHACGVDLSALAVVRVPEGAGVLGLTRAAELLLRSGGFGLVVVDLTWGVPRGPAWLGRLAALARQHDTHLALLTEGDTDKPSLGPMVGARIVPRRTRVGPGRYLLRPMITKDKQGRLREVGDLERRTPWGLP